MTKVIAYVRVSSKEQAEEGYSIEAQQKFLYQYALEHGLDIVREFVEVESAKASGRPAFNEMVAFLRKNKTVKTILCEKTDRLYRNFTDYVALDIEQQDLTLILAKEGEILSRESKSHQKLVHGLKVLLAKNYIDNLREETIKGMKEKAEQGEYPHAAPLGYLNNKETKKIELDPLKSPLVKKMFEIYAGGRDSLESLREKITKDGLLARRGKKIHKSKIELILKNPFYYGCFVWKEKLYQGTHPPLISKTLFDQVQTVLKRLHRPRVIHRVFPYTGLLTCAKCGCRITAEQHKGKYIYYHCTGFKGKCGNSYINQDDLEKEFGKAIKRMSIPDERLPWLKLALEQSHAEEKEYHNGSVEALTKELKQLQEWTDKAYQDKLQGIIDEDYWRKVSSDWKARQMTILDTLKRHQQANSSYLETGIRLLEFSNKAYKQFKVRESSRKREMLDFVLSNCQLNGKKVDITYRKPFDIIAKGSSGYIWGALLDKFYEYFISHHTSVLDWGICPLPPSR